MKRILVIGIVLLALIALIGVVSAGTTSKVDVSGDVQLGTLEVTTSGGISGWTLNMGDNTVQGVTVSVTNDGYPNGYSLLVVDALDASPCGSAKPIWGYMVAWEDRSPTCAWEWKASTYHFITPFHIIGEQGDIPLGNIPSAMWVTVGDRHGVPDVYTPTFKQTIVTGDKPASDPTVDADGYRIIVTFTAIPN